MNFILILFPMGIALFRCSFSQLFVSRASVDDVWINLCAMQAAKKVQKIFLKSLDKMAML